MNTHSNVNINFQSVSGRKYTPMRELAHSVVINSDFI